MKIIGSFRHHKTGRHGFTQKFAVILLFCAVLLALLACEHKPENPLPGIENIKTFRDIPGITQEEISAIEELKASRQSFSYGKMLSTEGFLLPDGTYSGFSPMFCELLSELFGIPFIQGFYDWNSLLNGIESGAIDFTSEFGLTTERQAKYLMSDHIAHRSLSILTFGNRIIASPNDLNGLRVGIFSQGSAISETIARAYPELDFITVPFSNIADEAGMLKNGEVDAVIGISAGMTHNYIETTDLNLFHGLLPLAYTPVSLTTANSELEPIISVVNKYISAGGINKLYKLYFEGYEKYIRNILYKSFSDEEKEYIDNLSGKVPIVLGTDTYPVSFFNSNEGEFQGISIDVLTEISRMTGIEFEPVNRKDASWGEILEMLKTGEAALISDLIITEERKEFFIWPETPFFSTPYAFFSKTEHQNLELYRIGHVTVGVVSWCATRQLYDKWFPDNTNIKLYDSQDEALDALERDEIDLFFNLGYILYYQQNYREKPGYKANFTFPVYNDTFFGLNKNEKILCSIIDKAIAFVNTDKISNEWTNRSFDYSRIIAEEQSRHANQRAQIVSISSFILILLMVIVVLLLIINYKIKKTAMEAGMEANERFKIMLDANPLCCKLWSSDYKLLDCNNAAVKLCGFNTKDEYLKGFFDLDPEFQPDGNRSDKKRAELLKHAFEDENNIIFEWLHVLPDGSYMPVEITLVRVKYGAKYVVAGYTRDLREEKRMINNLINAQEAKELQLTKAKNMEEKLVKAARFNQSIIETMPVGMLVYNGNPPQIIDCNDELSRMLKAPKQEIINRYFQDFMPEFLPDGRSTLDVAQEMSVRSMAGETVKSEWTYFTSDGDSLSCDITLTRVKDDTEFTGLAFTYDTTETHKRELELIHARQAAEVASRSKSNFLSNMSHEMRTPMNAIIGMTAIGKRSNSLEEKNHALNKIGDASSHLLGVINDVLDMAKIEADKLDLSPIEYSFERVLQKVLTVVNFRVEEKDQKLTLNIDNNIPRYLIGDEQRLTQIITNLMSNAVKFTPEGGDISLSASMIYETQEFCELRIEVTDSGIGISDEQKERLFIAFEQAEAGTSRQYGGTGLGLTLSKRIIELMGGNIWIESELGKGAKFIFTLKAKRSDRTDYAVETLGYTDDAKDQNIYCKGEFSGKNLLVAEDVEINREILIALLEDTGIVIDCAENGEEALKMVIESPDKYDVIFMDVQMPFMNGHEATRKIREFESNLRKKNNSSSFTCGDNPNNSCVKFAQKTSGNNRNLRKQIPIIAMTANVFKSDIEDCLAVGMDDHLGKPLDIDRVMEKLRTYLK